MKELLYIIVGWLLGVVSTVIYDSYKDYKLRKRLGLAISREISSLFELAKEKGWLSVIYDDDYSVREVELRTTHNYFIVYESNTNLIGILPKDLLDQIIYFYNSAKAFLEDTRLYSELSHRPNPNVDEGVRLRSVMKTQYEKLIKIEEEIKIQVEKELSKKFLYIIP